MTYKIDNDIPIPSAGGRGPRVDYPFLDMVVGQSIFVPDMNVKKMSGQVGFWKKQHNMNFAIRGSVEEVMTDAGELVMNEGVRVWIKDPTDKSNRGRKAAVAAPAVAADGGAAPAAAEAAPKSGKGKGKTTESDY